MARGTYVQTNLHVYFSPCSRIQRLGLPVSNQSTRTTSTSRIRRPLYPVPVLEDGRGVIILVLVVVVG